MKPGKRYRFSTPAKINLFLRIQGKRPDGYHELLLDYIPVTLFDHFELSLSGNEGLTLHGFPEGLPVAENLIVKAVRLLEKETGHRFPLRIQVEKNIPAGAGLGGGSANAAGMLVVMNRLCALSLSLEKLKSMALHLGADVPFFIAPKPSLASGIGETLSPLPAFDPLHLLLIHPGFAIATAEAYRTCHISSAPAPLRSYQINEITGLSPDMNDFWISLSRRYPELRMCRDALMENHACAAGVSGSGSTVFGVFRTERERNQAGVILSDRNRWQIVSCESIPGYDYPVTSGGDLLSTVRDRQDADPDTGSNFKL